MTDQVKIIVVEDDDDMYENYQDTAHEISEDGFQVKLSRVTTAAGAKQALLSSEFDGAIVDLNLTKTCPGEASGNDVLKEIVDRHRFPVFVVSGNLQNLEPEIRERESGFLKFYERQALNTEIFGELINIYNTGITKILGGRGKIEESLSEIFWNHLARDFGIWPDPNIDRKRSLLRYTISHLAEYLDIPDGEDKFYHEAEFYIKPPIKNIIASGDILEIGGERFINLSPACDVALRSNEQGEPEINAERIVLAPTISVDEASFLSAGIIKEEQNTRDRQTALEDIIKGKRERFSFLPGYGEISPAAIDFQNIRTFPFEEVRSATRIATVAGIFLKDIQSKFSAYYGRQGQPDLNKRELVRRYKGLLKAER